MRFFRRRGWKEVRPAGVLYCTLKNPPLRFDCKQGRAAAAKELSSKFRMTGWLLNDAETVRCVDPNAEHIRVRLTKDGIHGGDKGRVKTEKELSLLSAHAMKMLREAGESALQGKIAVSPYRTKTKEACAYCPFVDVCGFDPQIGYTYRLLDEKADVWQEMERDEKEAMR